MRPVDKINNRCARTYRNILVRPIAKAGLDQLKSWMAQQTWAEIIDKQSIDDKAELLQKMVLSKINHFLPEKTIRIASDDEPWITEDVKKWNRRRHHEYSKNKKSEKYQEIVKKYNQRLKV